MKKMTTKALKKLEELDSDEDRLDKIVVLN